jgi:transketolase C-terminal domain/subunit
LGGSVAESLAKAYSSPIQFIDVSDSFGELSEPNELVKKLLTKC